MAIFYSINEHKVPLTANLLMQISNLVRLKYLAFVSGENNVVDGSARLQCTVTLNFISLIGKQVGFNVRQYLCDFMWAHFDHEWIEPNSDENSICAWSAVLGNRNVKIGKDMKQTILTYNRIYFIHWAYVCHHGALIVILQYINIVHKIYLKKKKKWIKVAMYFFEFAVNFI